MRTSSVSRSARAWTLRSTFAAAASLAIPAFASPSYEVTPAAPGPNGPGGGGTCTLKHRGGPIISRPRVLAVYWGEVDQNAQKAMDTIVPAIVASPYMDALSEYNTPSQKIVRGSYLKGVKISPKSSGLSDDQVVKELSANIDSGQLPAPDFDDAGNTNTIYYVIVPDKAAQGAPMGLCAAGGHTCGYHGSGTYKGKPLVFAVTSEMNASGCRICGPTQAARLGVTVSHEIAEAVTDPLPEAKTAWRAQDCQGAEIGDICSPGGRGVGAGSGELNGATLSFEWSNAHGKCELTNPDIGPQGGCITSADCHAPTPACDTDKNACVACVSNHDCSGTTPTCEATTNTCHACAADADCGGATPVCDAKSGACVACKTSAQCTPAAPVCANSECTGCASDADCTDSSHPTCDRGSGACMAPRGASSGAPGGSAGDGGSGATPGDPTSDGGSNGNGCSASPTSPRNAFGVASTIAFGLACLARRRLARRRGRF